MLLPPHAEPIDAADRGAPARERLLTEATRIFAEKGYDRASTREICQAAGLNAGAIHYHFGGKDGLYREVLLAPVRAIAARLNGFDDPALPLAEALRRVLGAFLRPLAADVGVGADTDAEGLEPMMRLHLRETLEPSPGYADMVAAHIRPYHEALTRLLAARIGAGADEPRVQQLAFGLVAMAQDYCLSREFMSRLAPSLLGSPHALDAVLERLVDWGCALVAHERLRGAAPSTDLEP